MKPAKFNPDEIHDKIRSFEFGRSFVFKEKTASTNELAKRLAHEGTVLPCLILAEEQTGGKGRMQRSWYSPPFTGIWMSVIVQPKITPVIAGHYNFFMSLVIASAIETYADYTVELKWPNDILIHNKKVCGILSEITSGSDNSSIVIAGSGINVNIEKTDFPEEFRESATSLSIESGTAINRTELFIEIVSSLNSIHALWELRGIEPIFHSWLQKCTTIGQYIEIKSGNNYSRGVVQRINIDGSLVLQDKNGREHTIYAGDFHSGIREHFS
jgi:BirA family biotin operon repressor/biotin-[acetyl-CoA-carboxylase] ligase